MSSDSHSLSLTTGGITLLGVLISVGSTVGFGLSGPWWLRLGAGIGTTLVLGAIVKLGSKSGAGPLAKLARWVIASPDDDKESAD